MSLELCRGRDYQQQCSRGFSESRPRLYRLATVGESLKVQTPRPFWSVKALITPRSPLDNSSFAPALEPGIGRRKCHPPQHNLSTTPNGKSFEAGQDNECGTVPPPHIRRKWDSSISCTHGTVLQLGSIGAGMCQSAETCCPSLCWRIYRGTGAWWAQKWNHWDHRERMRRLRLNVLR